MISSARARRRRTTPGSSFRRGTWLGAIVVAVMMAAPLSAQARPAATSAMPATPSGSVSVRKIVVNNTGDPSVVPATFATTTHCSANAASPAAHTPVAVAANSTVTQPGVILAGLTCSVTEVVPAPIATLAACKGRGATWTAAYSAPVQIVAGQVAQLTVTNTISCNPPTGGTLQIHKSVVNTLGVPTPANFNMSVSCTNMNPVAVAVAVNATATVPPAGQIAEGTVCTIVETMPPAATGVKACPSGTASWVGNNPGPLTVHTAQTTGTIITNTLTCDAPPANIGALRVVKSVSNGTGAPVATPASFLMNVSCTPSGPSAQSLGVAPGPTGSTINGIAAGSQCTVTEPPVPPIASAEGCHGGSASWTSVISPAQPVPINANGVTNVTVRNSLKCDPPPSTNCANPSQTSMGCRITVTVKRSKGAPLYSVVVSPAATTPTPNIPPSTSSSCVIPGQAMINQVTCWFNYNTNPQSVTLTATSSTGVIPAGFNWGGVCSGSAPVCLVTVTNVPKTALANFP